MIKHIVFFSVKSEQDKNRVYNGLKILENYQTNAIIKIHRNQKIDQIANDVDFIVEGDFSNQESLESYKQSDLYQQSIDAVRPYRELRIAADFKF